MTPRCSQKVDKQTTYKLPDQQMMHDERQWTSDVANYVRDSALTVTYVRRPPRALKNPVQTTLTLARTVRILVALPVHTHITASVDK